MKGRIPLLVFILMAAANVAADGYIFFSNPAQVSAGITIYGSVRDKSGQPVPGAMVEIVANSNVSFIYYTNAHGGYRAKHFPEKIPPNKLDVSCKKRGWKKGRAFPRLPDPSKPYVIEADCVISRAG